MQSLPAASTDAGSAQEPPRPQAVVLYAEFTATGGNADTVAALLGGYRADVRAEPGNVLFEACRRDEDPDRFFVFEVYRDREAFQAHLGAPAGRAFNEALVPLIVEDASELSFLRPVAAS